jgi:hypothetical protein
MDEILGTVELRISSCKNSILERILLGMLSQKAQKRMRLKRRYGPGRIFTGGKARACVISIDDSQPQRIYRYRLVNPADYISIPVGIHFWLVFRFNREIHAHPVNVAMPKRLTDGQWLEKR